MPAPVIGVTTSRTMSRYGYPLISLTEAYTQALLRAGATPLLIPLGLSISDLSNLLHRLDGILFSGGGDIHPNRYGSTMHPLVDDIDADRDQVELELLQMTLQANLPFMGICRGLQLVNVGLGGSLYEDIQDQHPQQARHQFGGEKPRDYLAHWVNIDEGSRLAEILKTGSKQVNSLHHQGIRQLSPALRATAFSPDGIIEAVELPNYPFGLAVQWHPEWLPDDPAMVSLFHAFTAASLDTRTPA